MIAEDIIKAIINRTTKENKGFNPETGREFSLRNRPYSEEYANKKGVGLKDVDLELEGNMLYAMDVLNNKPDELTIGFEKGSDENAKAEGNQLGTYGQPSPIPGKARPFLGLSKKRLDEILSKYKDGDGD